MAADVGSDSAGLVGQLRAQLSGAGTAERAMRERAYLKSTREHYGVPVPQVRALTRAWLRENLVTTRENVIELAGQLWEAPVHECRLAAVEVLDARRSVLVPADLGRCEVMVRTAGTWALVDPLATNVVWSIVTGPGADDAGPVVDRWARDEDFWVRRAALLSQLRVVRAVDGDPSRFFGYAEEMLTDKEFFIRKAIGWVLRDMGRRRPDVVFEWLLPRSRRASGVTVREATKVFDEQQVAAITAARA